MPTDARPPSPFVDAVHSSLEALLTDLQKTTSVLKRGQMTEVEDHHQPQKQPYEIRQTVTMTKTVTSEVPQAQQTHGLDDLERMLDDYSAKRSQKVASERPNIDNLIAELDGPVANGSVAVEEVQNVGHARKGLDDLMDSLNSFQPNTQQVNDKLDSMLGSVEADMQKHGITTVPKGDCANCLKPIVGQVVIALGKMFHPEHFSCAHCGDELGHRNFFERSGKAYCEKDYHNLFSPRCGHCGGPIKDKCITALDQTFHPEHFFCAQCGKDFGEDGFHEKDGKPYCKQDYFSMFAPRCRGCDRPIHQSYITALGTQWHPECFVCADCKQPFASGSFFDHGGHPYCETHYHEKRGSLCAACGKPIAGRCVSAMAKKFHPEHFVCSFCLRQLNKGTFKEHEYKPYCHDCFKKLLS